MKAFVQPWFSPIAGLALAFCLRGKYSDIFNFIFQINFVDLFWPVPAAATERKPHTLANILKHKFLIMKNLVIIVIFFLIGHISIAQTGIINTVFSFQQINANQYSFTFHTFFSFGAGPTCPPFINHTFTVVGNTLQVKAFYDTTGAWPQVGCERNDTVFYNNFIPANVNFIEMSTNAIGYNNTPPYIPSTIMYENIFVQTFDISSLSNISFNDSSNNNVIIYPNPVQELFTISSNLDFNKIVVLNNLGQIVKNFEKNSSGNYDIKNIPNGIYYMIYYDFENKKIGESKILKN